MAKKIYTIGYSGFPKVLDFVETLKGYSIQIVIDVRSSPYSAYFEDYNKDFISATLKQNGIYYFNYAKQFGARQENRSFYKKGRSNVARLDFVTFTHSEQFLEGVSIIEKSNAVITFMCAEKEPRECHRTIMIARALTLLGHKVEHILPDGILKTQKDIDNELLEQYFSDRYQEVIPGFQKYNVEMSDEEYIREAYILQNDKIGFKLEELK